MAAAVPCRRGVIYDDRLGSRAPVAGASSGGGEVGGARARSHPWGRLALVPRGRGGELGRSDVCAHAFQWG